MKKTASVILIIMIMHALPVAAQVTAHVWQADTSWYDPQTRGFLPDSITPVLSIVNRGSDTAYQVSLTIEGQSLLLFADGNVSSTAVVASRLAPGDSLHHTMDMQVRGEQYQTSIPLPRQLFWQLAWEHGAARERRINEGHAIVLLSGDCPGGDGRDEMKGIEIMLPDSLVLDPGPDGFERRELEVYCLVFSREGLPVIVEDVTLMNHTRQSIAVPEMRRLTPLDSIRGRVIAPGDTLRVRFQVFVPYTVSTQHAGFKAVMTWRHRPECGNTIHHVERVKAMRLKHLPTRMATGEMWISLEAGIRVILRTSAWCGESPVDIDSSMVTLRDNGEAITPEYFEASRFRQVRRHLRAVFALDVTRSVGEAGLAAYRDAIRAWSRHMDSDKDSLAIFTLAGDARELLAWSADTARIDEALATLSLRDGHSVSSPAYSLLDFVSRRGDDSSEIFLFFTDGWYPDEVLDSDSLAGRALREGWNFQRFAVGTDINHDRLSGPSGISEAPVDALEMQRCYDEYLWNDDLVQFSSFAYTLSCRLGLKRDLALTLHGLCGADTTMQFSYTVPDDSLGEQGMRFLLRDATVTEGGTIELPVRYENALPQAYLSMEMLLRYDTTRLRFDSLVTRTVKNPPRHLVSTSPGLISVRSQFLTDRGMDDFAHACFSVLPTTDTTSTVVELKVWNTYRACSVLPSRDATVAIFPITTGITAETRPEDFRLLSVFPQPATDRFTIELHSDATAHCDYRMVDAIGREWLRGRLPAGGQGRRYHSISLPSDIPDGFYLLELRQGLVRRTATVPLRRK